MKLQENREIWINRVEDYKTSNLTQIAWAEQNQIKVSALRYWLRKLEDKINTSSNIATSSEFEFASVSISPDNVSDLVIEIKDVKLCISGDYNEGLLLRLIKTLKKL